MKSKLTFIGLILRGISAFAQPTFNSITPVSTSIGLYEKYEAAVNLSATYTNPYDYDQVALTAIFTAPNGSTKTVDGFYTEKFNLNTSDGNITSTGFGFKIRFAPTQIGNWTYTLTVVATNGTTMSSTQSFTCVSSTSKGFIRSNSTNYLSLDNGEQFIPIGQNQAWQNQDINAYRYNEYKNWIDKLAAQSANHIRLWMADWAFSLEWRNGSSGFEGLRRYKQSNAFYLDWVMDYAASKNTAVMLCLNHHGQVSTSVNAEWYSNPYYSGNGGPCSATADFFSNASAKNTLKNRLRYIVARWGYAKNLLAWELFNEVDFTDNFSTVATSVKDWHDEMAAYLRSKDANNHLVTTSFGHEGLDAPTWNLASMSFSQTHNYDNVGNIEKVVTDISKTKLAAYNKPTFVGEFNIGVGDGNALSNADANGVHIHNTAWATMFGGCLGSGMTWYWDTYIEPRNLYPIYKPLADFTQSLTLKADDYRPVTPSVTGGSGGSTNTSIATSLDFYVRATANAFTLASDGTLTPSASNLTRFIHGTWQSSLQNPPSFTATFAAGGQFKLNTNTVASSGSPTVLIYVDNVLTINQSASSNTAYTVNLSAGTHTIRIDNSGQDWFEVASYVFTNATTTSSAAVDAYILKANDAKKMAGWVHNQNYTHQSTAPTAITSATLNVSGMVNGHYAVTWFNTYTGATVSTATVAVPSSMLSIPIPSLSNDIAVKAVWQSIIPLELLSFEGKIGLKSDELIWTTANERNVKTYIIEESTLDGKTFKEVGSIAAMNKTTKQTYTFSNPNIQNGIVYYRLKMVDTNGTFQYAKTISLTRGEVATKFNIFPTLLSKGDNIMLHTEGSASGVWTINLVNLLGQVAKTGKYFIESNQDMMLFTEGVSSGQYILVVSNETQRWTQKLTVL
jgi:hypothetical protein